MFFLTYLLPHCGSFANDEISMGGIFTPFSLINIAGFRCGTIFRHLCYNHYMEKMTPDEIRILLDSLDAELTEILENYNTSLRKLVRIASETGQPILSVAIQHPAMTDLTTTLKNIVRIYVEAERLKKLLAQD